jgi:hypothetical protein
VGLSTGLDDGERRKILPIPGLELQPLGRIARSQSLYRVLIIFLINYNYRKYINMNLNTI